MPLPMCTALAGDNLDMAEMRRVRERASSDRRVMHTVARTPPTELESCVTPSVRVRFLVTLPSCASCAVDEFDACNHGRDEES